MNVLIFVGTLIVGLLIVVAVAWSGGNRGRTRRGTAGNAANYDGSSWLWSASSDGGSSGCDAGSAGGCDGGGGE
jgi:hypothetical protein